MIRNYLVVGLRNFKKGHVYSFINLFGLALGLSGVMLIIAYITYELSFDQHFPGSDRIFQIVMESDATGRKRLSFQVARADAPPCRRINPERLSLSEWRPLQEKRAGSSI